MADDQTDGGTVYMRNDRDGIILRAMQQCDKYEADIKEITEDYKEYKKGVIKGQLGYTLKDWSLLRYLYLAEQKKRDRTIDTIREGARALKLGEIVNWVDIVEKETESATPALGAGSQAATSEEVAMRNQGRQAALNNVPFTNNPAPVDTTAHEAWAGGWLRGQAEMAQKLAVSPEETAGQMMPLRRRGRKAGETPRQILTRSMAE